MTAVVNSILAASDYDTEEQRNAAITAALADNFTDAEGAALNNTLRALVSTADTTNAQARAQLDATLRALIASSGGGSGGGGDGLLGGHLTAVRSFVDMDDEVRVHPDNIRTRSISTGDHARVQVSLPGNADIITPVETDVLINLQLAETGTLTLTLTTDQVSQAGTAAALASVTLLLPAPDLEGGYLRVPLAGFQLQNGLRQKFVIETTRIWQGDVPVRIEVRHAKQGDGNSVDVWNINQIEWSLAREGLLVDELDKRDSAIRSAVRAANAANGVDADFGFSTAAELAGASGASSRT